MECGSYHSPLHQPCMERTKSLLNWEVAFGRPLLYRSCDTDSIHCCPKDIHFGDVIPILKGHACMHLTITMLQNRKIHDNLYLVLIGVVDRCGH